MHRSIGVLGTDGRVDRFGEGCGTLALIIPRISARLTVIRRSESRRERPRSRMGIVRPLGGSTDTRGKPKRRNWRKGRDSTCCVPVAGTWSSMLKG